MGLPKKLTNGTIVYDGSPLAGRFEEVTLPTLERETEEYRGGAMLGPVHLDKGLKAITLSVTMAEFSREVLTSWGVKSASGAGVRFLGAAMADDDTLTDAVEITARGRVTKLEMGSSKAGDMTKPKFDMALAYFKFSVNGEGLVEIDLVNGKEVVFGTDRSAAALKALGLV